MLPWLGMGVLRRHRCCSPLLYRCHQVPQPNLIQTRIDGDQDMRGQQDQHGVMQFDNGLQHQACIPKRALSSMRQVRTDSVVIAGATGAVRPQRDLDGGISAVHDTVSLGAYGPEGGLERRVAVQSANPSHGRLRWPVAERCVSFNDAPQQKVGRLQAKELMPEVRAVRLRLHALGRSLQH